MSFIIRLLISFYQVFKREKFEHIKFMYDFCKVADVSLEFSFEEGGHCESLKNEHTITIGILDKNYLSTFFHEFAHILNYKENKFEVYHKFMDLPYIKKISSKYINIWKRTALRAEQYTDLRGAKLMKQYFPEKQFQFCYFSYGIKYMKELHIPFFEAFIDDLKEKAEEENEDLTSSES